ncbi:MAG: hypothetical protein WC662_00330 [Candidatus Paceibacterota bacterium]
MKKHRQVNWLGAETKRDQAIIMVQLRKAYQNNYLLENEEEMLGIPDFNGQIVAEALRIHLLSDPILVKAEFDDAIKGEEEKQVPIPLSVYEQETKKLQSMTKEEIYSLETLMLREEGYERDRGSSCLIKIDTCSNNIKGFAIDTQSFVTLTTSDYGMHYYASEELAWKIYQWSSHHNIVGGLIVHKVGGFTTPILRLFNHPLATSCSEEQSKAIAEFIKKEGKYLLVDHDCNPM